jgi:clan AA aspartic protease (TIGR02281 family)
LCYCFPHDGHETGTGLKGGGRHMACRLVAAAGFAAALFPAAVPLPGAAQALGKCVAGVPVIDRDGRTGTIISQGGALCRVRYPDGQVYGWIYWNLRPVPGAAQPDGPAVAAGPPQPPNATLPAADDPAVTVLRPARTHGHAYRAGPNGHFVIAAEVNGAPVRFLVDTGASLVFLTPDDASAVGFAPRDLDYTQRVNTANGMVRVAPVVLREVRIDDLALDNVRAAVVEHLGQSVLGMSFLDRLNGFTMRGGLLTLTW